MLPKQLKNGILHLAITGKLVKQNPNDEPASVLLEKIKAEKQKLIKEGKIKKDKNESIIFRGEDGLFYEKIGKEVKCINDDIPFEIPDSWQWVRLGNVGNWRAGSTPPKTNPEYYGGNIPFLKTGDLNDSYIDYIPENITELALQKLSIRLNPADTVLIAMYGATIGKLGILKFPATTNQACCACVVYEFLYNKYLFYFLMSMRSKFIGMGVGGAQPNISKEKIISTLIPLPPLEEQKRIAEKLDEIMPLIDIYDENYTELEKLDKEFPSKMKKSILQEAIQGKLVKQNPDDEPASVLLEKIRAEKQKLIKEGKIKKDKNESVIFRTSSNDFYEKFANGEERCINEEIPFEIPNSWQWVRLGSVGNWRAGSTPPKTNPEYWNGNIPFLKTGDLNDNYIDYIPENITELALQKLSIRLNPADTVLIAMYGATIGKIGILKFPATTNQACCACIVYEFLYNKYLFYFLMSMRSKFISMGVGGAQPNISKEKIISTLIPLPPLEEQKRIVAKIEEIFKTLESLEEK